MSCSLSFLLLVSLFQVSFSTPSGIATLEPVGVSTAHGTVWFQPVSGGMNVTVDLEGVPDGDHGLHVHTFGDISDKGAGTTTGGHYVGLGSETHSCPPSAERHEGDMGNWTAVNGRIVGSKIFDLLTLTDSFSIIGRGVVLHELADDCTGSSGNAGGRIAQGVIGIMNTAENDADNSFTTFEFAIASLSGTTNCPDCAGTVWFHKQNEGQVMVTAKLMGLEMGSLHGFHIHEYGDLSDPTGVSAGGHYNPEGVAHALPPTTPRHAGDLGNIQSYDQSGVAWYQFVNENVGPLENLLGRGVIVHADKDHGDGYECGSTGNAGSRLMNGVIGVAATDTTLVPQVPIEVDTNWMAEDCAQPEPVQTLNVNFNFSRIIPPISPCSCDDK